MAEPLYLDLTRSDDETVRTVALMLAMVAERRNHPYELIEIPNKGCVLVVTDLRTAALILSNITAATNAANPLLG